MRAAVIILGPSALDLGRRIAEGLDADLHGRLEVLERLKHGESADELIRSWSPALENFRRQRARALLYP